MTPADRPADRPPSDPDPLLGLVLVLGEIAERLARAEAQEGDTGDDGGPGTAA